MTSQDVDLHRRLPAVT